MISLLTSQSGDFIYLLAHSQQMTSTSVIQIPATPTTTPTPIISKEENNLLHNGIISF